MAKQKSNDPDNPAERIRYSLGSTLLDTLVGGGLGMGIPAGKILNLWGDKSSGKTFLACEILAAAYHKFGKDKFKWDFDDCESGFSFDTQRIWGFEIMPKDLEDRTRSETVEQLYGNIRQFLESLKPTEFGVYIVDSLDGLQDEAGQKRGDERFKAHKKGEAFDKGSYQMTKPKFLSSEFFPPIAALAEEKNCLVIIISQERDNVDSFSFEKNTRSGGRAMDFYAHTVLGLLTVSKIMKKGRPIGVITRAKTFKNKTPRPFREAFFNIYFDYGIDDISSNIDFLFDLRTENGQLSSKTEAVSWNGKKASKADVAEFIEANFEAADLKAQKIKPKYDSKEKMEEWLFNQFDSAPELKKSWEEKFGTSMTRDELIRYVEENSLEEELRTRALEKWETIEASIKIDRKPKYGGSKT